MVAGEQCESSRSAPLSQGWGRSSAWVGFLQSICLFIMALSGCSQGERGSEAIASRADALAGPAAKPAPDHPLVSVAPGTARGRTVWVVMKQQPSLTAATALRDWQARGRAVHATLTANAAASQQSLLAFLSARRVAHESFWIVNAIKVSADDDTIQQIAARPDVQQVLEDRIYRIPAPQPVTAGRQVQAVEWNLESIRAPEAWEAFGTRGEDIVVANIDTGVDYTHPALVGKYRGLQADGSFDHNYNWHDPSEVCGDEPCDNVFHGTHTMGTIVGDDGADNQIGVAPGAKWIAAKGCEDFGCSYDALLSAGQWIVAPTDLAGENPSPERRPHVVNNSWGGPGGDPFYEQVVDAWIAAGIFPVFSAGNEGEFGCETVGSPGDYPQSYAVGAYDEWGEIAYFSSRGPSFDGLTKPNVAAPGQDVRSAVPGAGYDWSSGTSMAAPHVTGAVALLWSAAPALVGDIEATRALMDSGAQDRDDPSCGGTPENNNVWGEGQLDVVAALEEAPIGPTGTLTGTVTATDGQPIRGAAVAVVGPAERQTLTDSEGRYRLRLPVGSYEGEARAFGYLPQIAPDIAIEQDQELAQDFALAPAPAFSVSGTVVDSSGVPLLGAAVTLTETPLPTVYTDAAGGFVFESVPVGEYVLTVTAAGCFEPLSTTLAVDEEESLEMALESRQDAYGYQCHPVAFEYIEGEEVVNLEGDDEQELLELPFAFTFYGQTYDSVSVTTNGFLSFEPEFPEYWNQAIPSQAPPNAAIYALWDDLVVWDQGTILTATFGEAPDRTYVVEWRDIAFLAEERLTVSFEVVLHEGGEIQLQYLTAGPEPMQRGDSATVGIEDATGTIGLQYSYDQAVLRDGLSVLYEIPFMGTVEGTVLDANDGLPIGGVTVAAVDGEGQARTATTDEEGFYRLQLTAGAYQVTASATRYEPSTISVTVEEDQVLREDFHLRTALAALSPSTLQLLIEPDQVRVKTLALSNSGSLPLEFELVESGGSRQSSVPTATLAREPNADPNARTTAGVFKRPPSIDAITPLTPGDVLFSFVPEGMSWVWGVGVTENLWLSDPEQRRNHEFTFDGASTGLEHPASWAGDWPADMAYDAGRDLVCQVAVGGDNGIHCWEPATGEVVYDIAGPFRWTEISQRGLAYRPDDDTFYVGGWNDGLIYHIQGLSYDEPGTVISSCQPAQSEISGLAWNGTMGVLWMATNSETDAIYELNPDDCTVLSTLEHPESSWYQGAGLDMAPDGNLWMIGQESQTAYLVESGVPAASDVSWLTIVPTEGSVDPGEERDLTVVIDTADLEPGLYLASIHLRTSAGRQPTLRIPVSLVVTGYDQAVNVGGGSYVDSLQDTWDPDQAHVSGSWGYTRTRSRAGSTRAVIAGTPDPTLYQTNRTDPYAYRFDEVPNGVYDVALRFAEWQNVGEGGRLFDVIIEDTLVLPAHDITYEVGRRYADDHHFFIEVTDEQMDVRFVPRAGSKPPIVNAVRVTHRPDR